jgi:hypothetical protein
MHVGAWECVFSFSPVDYIKSASMLLLTLPQAESNPNKKNSYA